MTRVVIFQLTQRFQLKMHMKKENTTYKDVISIFIKMVCASYKFMHVNEYLACSKLFGISKSSICMVLHEFI
jgi:hypothetical protein